MEMLDDLKHAGVDEDLEMLRASWRAPQARQSRGQAGVALGRRPFERLGGEPTELNCLAEQASRRLRTVEHLRHMATEARRTAGTDVLCLNDLATKLQHDTVNTQGFGFSDDVDDHLASWRSMSSKPRWRGPFDADSDEEEDYKGGLTLAIATQRARFSALPRHRSSAKPTAAEDPWDAWESRWADAFRRMDAAERAKRQAKELEEQRRFLEEQEARRQHWEQSEARRRFEAERVRQRREARQDGSGPSKGWPWSAGNATRNDGRASSRPGFSSAASGGSNARASGSPGGSPKGAGSGGSSTRGASGSPPTVRHAATTDTQEPDMPRFASFDAYDRAWAAFEQNATGGGPLRCADIPWPLSLGTASGVSTQDDAATRKKKLHKALLRWHPDKCEKWLGRVQDTERARIVDRIKEVTRTILKEKECFGG